MNQLEENRETQSWINENFIETILRGEENDDGISVTQINVENAVPKGDNYGSTIMRVSVEYISKKGNNREIKTVSLIVKSLPEGEYYQKLMSDVGAFVKELRIYGETLPKIYKLFEKNTGLEHEDIATNFYATDRPDTIILGDLRPLGYKMTDRRQGMDLDHSGLAIRTLAKLHASSMVLYEEDPEALEHYMESFYVEPKREMLSDFFEKLFNNLAIEVETWPGFDRFAEKLKLVSASVVDRIIEMAKNKNGAMKVLNHGDFWTNNMLFRYENGKPADVKMLDFQIVRFASPALDILYFLHTSPSQDILEDYWDHLIGEYLDSLNDTLQCLGDQRVVSLEDINRELEDKAFFAVVISATCCMMMADPEDAPNLSDIKDEDVERGKGMGDTISKAFAGQRFQNTLKVRLQKFEKQGLI